MNWTHAAVAVGLFLVGFVVAKKYPGIFSGIPGLNVITG